VARTTISGIVAAMHDDVRRRHGHHRLAVREVVQETSDAVSFVLEVPDDLADLFAYRAGQFCTFRVDVGGEELHRCYSMSSTPETDPHLTVTVKRVPGGAVSNWLLDKVQAGDALEATPPAGVFCVPEGDGPIVGFCGGSGVTPLMSIAKHVVAATDRSMRLLCANRDASSVIFGAELEDLAAAHQGRLVVQHHLDTDGGFLDARAVTDFLADLAEEALCYLCGPPPFMDLVEAALLDAGVSPDRILLERFGDLPVPDAELAPATGGDAAAADVTETVTIVLKGKRHDIGYHQGDTVLQTARRGGLQAPYSCEAGDCATCMAMLQEGSATMRANNALTPDEVAEGWVLTCQALPQGRRVTVEYEDL
jgi:3-ketosteroid 9alpha-monooxygenase subunit B